MVGDYITVVEWKTFLNDKEGNLTHRKDQSFIGDCMKIIAADGALLRVKNLDCFNSSFTLNLDKVVVRKLSRDFINAVKVAK